MNIYVCGTSGIKLERRGEDEIYYTSIEKFLSLLKSSNENDVFLWQYDYPWNDSSLEKEFSTKKLEGWNENLLVIISEINKIKNEVILFNGGLISLSSIIECILKSKGKNKFEFDVDCEIDERNHVFLAMLCLWGKKYWRTLEILDGLSVHPYGARVTKKNVFLYDASSEKLCMALDYLSKQSVSEVNNNERFNEIAVLTLMLREQQELYELEVIKNNDFEKYVKSNQIELKENSSLLYKKNKELEIKIKASNIELESLKEEISSKKNDNDNYKLKAKNLDERLKELYKCIDIRFDEIATLTDMLETARSDITLLEGELISVSAKHEKIKNSFLWKATAPIRALRKPMISRNGRNEKRLIERVRVIKDSKYFDIDWYLLKNPDVKKSGIDPAKHYLLFGGFENRDPSRFFSNEIYLELHPDVREKGMNPLEHYITFGVKENRKTRY